MGTFAVIADVSSRYVEGGGELPDDVTAAGGWVDLRITDVENELMGLVPSLDGADLSQIRPSRLGRIKSLVCDKVLDLYRNPQRAKSFAQGMGDINTTTSMSNGFGAMIDFTEQELDRVRDRTPRSRFGTAVVTPWKISTRTKRGWC